ncbi:hypothetical protein ACFODL_14685 [Phenylobacterium terrae]|uniref:SPOR domain-containing protein n=1 Tax=Phenylobacterium terrae TaxID=2665495 RepID=A0ABW4N1K0_9CAUL
MSIEGQRGPIPSGVYNGFSAPVRNLRRGAGSRAGKILMGGVAAAAVLGVAFGLFAKPDVADDDGLGLKPDEMVQIEVGPGRAPVVPGGPVQPAPLQTLPPGADAPTVVVTRGPEPRAESTRREPPPPEPAERAEEAAAPRIEPESIPDPAFAADEGFEAPEEIFIPPPEFADE